MLSRLPPLPFSQDVFPNQPGGWRILQTPNVLKVLFDPAPEDPAYNPLPEERPGGFEWGGGAEANQQQQQEEEQQQQEDQHPHRD